MAIRNLAVWIAERHNGWTAHVAEMIDGLYHASAAPTGSNGFLTQYVEMDAPSAKAAAEYSLMEKTGHRVCSGTCTGWKLHTHAIDRPGS